MNSGFASVHFLALLMLAGYPLCGLYLAPVAQGISAELKARENPTSTQHL
jgi:hypothetical protein